MTPLMTLLMIRPIQKRQSLGADIAQQLQEMLVNGTYKPGDILPSQRALAEQFGTSLATGVPARLITTSSPASTRASRRERWVFASCTLTFIDVKVAAARLLSQRT